MWRSKTMYVKIAYFVNCTILYICKGFFKINIPHCNNNDEVTSIKVSFGTRDGNWLKEVTGQRNAVRLAIRRLDFQPKCTKCHGVCSFSFLRLRFFGCRMRGSHHLPVFTCLRERETEMRRLGAKVVLGSDLGSTQPSWVTWASDLPSLNFSYLIHKVGIIISSSLI